MSKQETDILTQLEVDEIAKACGDMLNAGAINLNISTVFEELITSHRSLSTLIDQQAQKYKELREQFCDLSRERVAERDQLIVKINQGADLNRVLERDNFNTEANLQAINSSLNLAIKALERIEDYWEANITVKTYARDALDQIRGEKT